MNKSADPTVLQLEAKGFKIVGGKAVKTENSKRLAGVQEQPSSPTAKQTAPSKKQKLPKPYEPFDSQLEFRFNMYLKGLAHAGLIKDYHHEPFKFILGNRLTYLPDFLVVHSLGRIEIIEVKGKFKWEDSIVKLKSAATQAPYFDFWMVEEDDKEWKFTHYPEKGCSKKDVPRFLKPSTQPVVLTDIGD